MNLPTIKSEIYEYEFVPGDLQELLRWCRTQAEFFGLVANNGQKFAGDYGFSQIYSICSQLGSLAVLAEAIEKLANQAENEHIAQQIDQYLVQVQQISRAAFIDYRLPPADTEVALNLKAVVEKDHSIGVPALFALSRNPSLPNQQFNTWTSDVWRGLGLGAFLSSQNTVTTKPQRYAKAYREMVTTAQTDLSRTRQKAEMTLTNLRKDISLFSSRVTAFEEAHAKQLTQTTGSTAQILKDVAKEIADFKTFVKSEIALKAPVTYWEEKAQTHQNIATGFGILSVVLMCFFAGIAYYFAKEITSFAGTSYVGLALVGVIVTLAFWMLRLSVRIFLGQQHMASDSKERVAMVKTYLALHEAGLAPKEGDLTPVLVALFRPSSDGMVKDEAMPPVLAEILTRTKTP